MRPLPNYSSEAFAPGRDPRVCLWASPEPPLLAPGLRAASIAATSSTHPLNGREFWLPCETKPVIGSESSSIDSSTCAVSFVTVRMMRSGLTVCPRQVPQD